MQSATQASYQMVLVIIKMITREFKDWGVMCNGLGKCVERFALNHFPWCLFFVPVLLYIAHDKMYLVYL